MSEQPNNPPTNDRTDYAGRQFTNRPTDPFANPPVSAPVNPPDNVPTTDREPDQVGRSGRVIDFPQRTDDEASESVFEGALLTDAENAELDQRISRAVAVRQATLARASKAALIVRESERPAQLGRVVARTGVSVYLGLESWARRAWDGSTLGVYRRQIRAAEAVGDHVRLGEWAERMEQIKQNRYDRLRDLPTLVGGIARVAVGVIAGMVLLTLLTGAFVQLSGAGEFTNFITTILDVIRWVFTAFALTWTPLVLSLPFWLLLGAWREGRRRGNGPKWLATAGEADTDVTIDETTIARALGALRVPQITSYLKEGLPLQFLTPARVDGRGTHAVLRLPAGVTAEKIARRRGDLATGLHRLAKEVWPTTGTEAGILDLWVADKGALAEGAGAYPLLAGGVVDVFKGVPFGKNLRGAPVQCPLMERNTITGGMPGQGKSSAARVMMAGAALDPSAELRIWVPDANFDFEAFRPRCSRYVMGAEDEKIEEILAHLRELHAEVQARGDLLVRYETPAVTRELASRNIGLHPLFCLLEEAHVAIQHPKFGAEIAKLLVDIVRLGRKRGIHVLVSTQAPTKDSMPRDVTRNCSNGVAFAVGDHVANDALLGQGAYTAGHRATELIPGTDRGTAVVKGFSGQRSDIVQVYYLDVAKENDQVTPIIDRAMAAIEERGRVPGGVAPAIEASRDLLEDLDAVLGDDPVPVADLPALLAQLAPRWLPYRQLTGKALRERLAAEYGVKVPSTGNKWPVDPVTVRDSLAARATEDLDDEA
jgi:S-DNA-T family DNA segregation ATPase FtsK/SpoIIIE